MATYYLKVGFIVRIKRDTGSLFSGAIYRNGNGNAFAIFNPSIPSLELNYYLNHPGVYTFEFQNSSSTDPVKFEIGNYETLALLYTITFPLDEPLVVISGMDGESNNDLSINYPLKSFLFLNPTKLNLIWYCIPWDPDCAGLEASATLLPEPKIIGNLSGCAVDVPTSIGSDDYQGDLTQDVVCDNEVYNQYYLLGIYAEGNLLYSRLECCCPTVVPTDVPPEPEIGFVCTCPDWGQATSYNQTLFSSSVRLRQWVQSNAGSKGDCKHIMAAKRILGIDQPIYTDPPYSAPPPPSTPG